jgi:Zn-dependent protease
LSFFDDEILFGKTTSGTFFSGLCNNGGDSREEPLTSMECHYCGSGKEGLPFRCNYCGEFFCSEHRLPENHSCPRVGGPKQPGHSEVRRYNPYSSERRTLPYIRSSGSRFRLRYAGIFSNAEEKHILVASLVVVFAGILTNFFISPYQPLVNPSPLFFVITVPAYLVSFLGHEIAHKFMARRNGLWAEFRTNLYGLMLTAVSSVFLVKFLAPGQVIIHGNGNKEMMGGISLVGPGFNLAIGTMLIILSRFPAHFLGSILVQIAWFNAWMALINLIPFGTLDGTRVFDWDKTRWGISLAGSILLVVLSYYYLIHT